MVDTFTAEYALKLLSDAKLKGNGDWPNRNYTNVGLVEGYQNPFDERATLALHPNHSIKRRMLRKMFGKYAGQSEDSDIFYDANENLLFLTTEEAINSFVGSLTILKERPPVIRKERHPMQSIYQ